VPEGNQMIKFALGLRKNNKYRKCNYAGRKVDIQIQPIGLFNSSYRIFPKFL